MLTNENYLDVLKDIVACSPSSVIAGGAIRDFILDKEIADIDWYVSDAKAALQTLSSSFFVQKAEDVSSSEYNNEGVQLKTNVIIDDLCPIQIIETQAPLLVYTTFCLSLSKCYLHEHIGLCITSDAVNAMASKTLTFDKAKTSLAYIEKIRKKYPDYVCVYQ